MARRSDHSRDELLEMASTALSNIVEAEGFGAISARKVAQRIGYSVGTLYNLFDNLSDMILHVNGLTLERLDDHLARSRFAKSEADGDPRDIITGLLDAYLSFVHAQPHLWNMVFAHTMGADAPLPDWYRAKIDNVLAHLEAALAPFTDNNQDAAEVHARLLWASLHGILSLAQSGKLGIVSNQPAADMARALVANYLAGLQATPESLPLTKRKRLL